MGHNQALRVGQFSMQILGQFWMQINNQTELYLYISIGCRILKNGGDSTHHHHFSDFSYIDFSINPFRTFLNPSKIELCIQQTPGCIPNV